MKQVLLFVAAILGLVGTSSCTSQSKKDPPNTLHLVSVAKIKGLDPIHAEDLYTGLQIGNVYETLLQYHYLKRPYTLIPSLAEAMPEVGKDRITYTFRLKKGVLFQDDPCFAETHGKGRELTAEDVVYSFKRVADPKLASTGWWIFEGAISGLDQWRTNALKSAATDYSAVVEGLRATDRYTVEIKLTKPSSRFLYTLAMVYSSIVPKEAVDHYGKEFINHPVGTGPFQIAELNPNSKISWIKNPTYRKDLYPAEGAPGDKELGLLEDAHTPLPRAEKLVFHVMQEQQPMWLSFLSGKLDIASIPKDNYSSTITPEKDLVPELKVKGLRLVTDPALDVVHMTFNMKDPILGKNKLLRQALSLAYDSASFIQLFYNGRAIPAQSPVPPGLAGYDSDFKNPYRIYSIQKARELLAKAGYPGGKGLPTFQYATLASSFFRQAAEYAQKMFASIGVKISVDNYSWPQFLEAIKTGKAQLWEYAWLADYPDAESFFQLFYSKNASPGPNDSSYSNLEFDSLYEKILYMPVSAERTAIFKQMRSIIVEDCPWIFNAHRINYAIVQPWLKNYKPNDFDHFRFKYYRVDEKLKK